MDLSKFLMTSLVRKPLSQVWESAYKIRRVCYEYGFLKKSYFKVPIISIGNITFGGTGKTPLIIWMVQQIEGWGFKPVVLTRGYKGKLEHSSGIIHSNQKFLSNPTEYGDEPLLISRKMKKGAVIVGKKRSENLKKYFSDTQPDVVLLDDGFQHIQLYRSLNIVVFDAHLPLASYKTAPLGYLREGFTALKDADIILISRADQVNIDKINRLKKLLAPYHAPNLPMGMISYQPLGVFDGHDQKIMETSELAGKRVIALTAIASPESFYHLLEEHGAEILDKVVFPDHHFFNHRDINELLGKCLRHDALIVTSEKDMVKIKKITKDSRILYVNIGVQFLSGENEVVSQIKNILNVDYNA